MQAFNYVEETATSAEGKRLSPAGYENTQNGPADRAIITIRDADVVVRYDGVVPAAVNAGHVYSPGVVQIILSSYLEIRNFRFRGNTGATTTLSVSYLRYENGER